MKTEIVYSEDYKNEYSVKITIGYRSFLLTGGTTIERAEKVKMLIDDSIADETWNIIKKFEH